jgi:hypothetical protein
MRGLWKTMINLTQDKRLPTEDEINFALCSSQKK